MAEITELWVENSQKINCHDITSTWEGTVSIIQLWGISTFSAKKDTKEKSAKLIKINELLQVLMHNFVSKCANTPQLNSANMY